jgi:hypothetical protein
LGLFPSGTEHPPRSTNGNAAAIAASQHTASGLLSRASVSSFVLSHIHLLARRGIAGEMHATMIRLLVPAQLYSALGKCASRNKFSPTKSTPKKPDKTGSNRQKCNKKKNKKRRGTYKDERKGPISRAEHTKWGSVSPRVPLLSIVMVMLEAVAPGINNRPFGTSAPRHYALVAVDNVISHSPASSFRGDERGPSRRCNIISGV